MAAKKSTNNNKKKSSTIKKSDIKKAKKAVKKAPKGLIIFIVILVIAAIVGGVIYLVASGKFDEWFKSKGQTTTTSVVTTTDKPKTTTVKTTTSHSSHEAEDGITEDIIYENFQIHFLELGNDAAGDSVYIKAGDNDILIDAGSRKNSAETIKNYVDKYCTDGKLEYVIATHAHQDHIAGFIGNASKNTRTGIMYQYKIDTLIDFVYSDVTSKLYTEEYIAAVDYAKSQGTVNHKANYYFDNKHNPKGDAHIALTADISMDIIYNKFYFEKSDDENNYSVCTMFNYNDKHYLLTGDLELEGEESIAAYYDASTPAKTLPKVELFKAGHHGSKTSSNECLLRLIEPKICVACCCAGTSEYTNNLEHQFPTQAFINRIAQYTSRVYVTSMIKLIDGVWQYTSMNGNVIVSSNGANVGLSATNNLTRLKDTEWFNEKIYAVKTNNTYTWNEAGDKFYVYQNCPKSGSTDFYTKDTEEAVLIPRRTWPENGK